jgi:hypothetical protein
MSTGLPSLPDTPSQAADQPSTNGIAAGQSATARIRTPSAERRERWAASPTFTRSEISLAALAGLLLAILTTWPLVLHMSSRIAPDLGDPVRTAWEIAWVGHAMLHNPLHLFNANAFYPHPLSLAFSDSLLGYGPTAFFGSGTVAALVRYNLLFLWVWSLCFVAAYLLARELGLGRLGASAAGLAFAYAPYRVTEAGHLHVISSGGFVLAMFLLLRGYRRNSRKLVLAGWLVSAWQVSLGFTLGLQYCYLLVVLALLVVFYWWRGHLSPGSAWQRPAQSPAAQGRLARIAAERGALIPRRLLAVSLIGMAVLGAVTVYQARPYLKVADEYPTAKRTLAEVETYSAGPAALLSASSENRVWGEITEGMRAKVNSKNESVFFPGGLILALALIGLLAMRDAPYTRRLRIGLLAGIIVVSILALGFGITGAGYPYRLLYNYAPGWDGVRVPGRIFTLATLFYALLAGAGAQLLVKRLHSWRAHQATSTTSTPAAETPAGRPKLARPGFAVAAVGLPALVGVALLVGILGEGAGHLGHPVVPQPAEAEIGLRGPLLDLPTDGALDRIWQYFSTNGFYEIPVGNSTFDLPAVDDLRGGMNGFPDRASVEKLRYYGIHTVVLHTVLPRGLPPEHGPVVAEPPHPAAAAAKPIAGLGISKRRAGSLVIYEIGPGPAALHGTDP